MAEPTTTGSGGTGRDILTGGTGKDTFSIIHGDSFAYNDRADHITDFNSIEGDRIFAGSYVRDQQTLGSNTLTPSSIEDARNLANPYAADHHEIASAVFNSSNGHDAYV